MYLKRFIRITFVSFYKDGNFYWFWNKMKAFFIFLYASSYKKTQSLFSH